MDVSGVQMSSENSEVGKSREDVSWEVIENVIHRVGFISIKDGFFTIILFCIHNGILYRKQFAGAYKSSMSQFCRT